VISQNNGCDVNTNADLGKRPIGFKGGQAAADFVGLNPRWQPVQAAMLAMLPWSSICAISITRADSTELAGTGWLAGPATVITAAHVIASASHGNGDLGFQVRFPGTGLVSTALDAHFHDRYRGDPGDLFDPFDIAALRIEDPGLPALPIVQPVPALDSVEVAGYPGMAHGTLVTHSAGAVRLANGLVLHTADTKDGHSGAPVLATAGPGQERVVVALHVQGYEGNPEAGSFPEHNVALALEKALADFVRVHLRAA
jgi:hypothetical protein